MEVYLNGEKITTRMEWFGSLNNHFARKIEEVRLKKGDNELVILARGDGSVNDSFAFEIYKDDFGNITPRMVRPLDKDLYNPFRQHKFLYDYGDTRFFGRSNDRRINAAAKYYQEKILPEIKKNPDFKIPIRLPVPIDYPYETYYSTANETRVDGYYCPSGGSIQYYNGKIRCL